MSPLRNRLETQKTQTMACRVRNIRTSHEQRRRASSAFLHDTSQLSVPLDALHTRRGSANSIHDSTEQRRPTLGCLGVGDLKYLSAQNSNNLSRRRSSLAPPSPGASPVRRRSAPDRPFAFERKDSNENMELRKRNVFATLVVVCLGLLLVMLLASYLKGWRMSAV